VGGDGRTGGDGAVIRVAIVSDQRRARADMRFAFAADRSIAIVREIPSVADLSLMATRLAAVILVVNLRPDSLTELTLQRAVRRASLSGAKLVIYASQIDAAQTVAALRLGASGFVWTDADSDDLPTVTRAVANGNHLPNARAARLLLATKVAKPVNDANGSLTRSGAIEDRILSYIGEGMPNVEVAAALGLHPATTYAYTNHLMAKLHAPGRMQLALYAHERDLVPSR
jgi:DNA-binding NarL/FixJ family response regulator